MLTLFLWQEIFINAMVLSFELLSITLNLSLKWFKVVHARYDQNFYVQKYGAPSSHKAIYDLVRESRVKGHFYFLEKKPSLLEVG